ncbi:MAG: porin [Proteobacteria bacterium]|uniref:OprO/OprP family phosphate-selective porin n=1 Tax=Rudaea sp. TaxID=2136325 RepID=UPI0032206B84|nr:porin [Pseudomonadota bacterium]
MSTYAIHAHAYDWLNDWRTRFKTDAGYEFGSKGNFQADINDYSGDTTNPAGGAKILEDQTTWRRKELYAYAKAPFGVDATAGYDLQSKLWVDNFFHFGNNKIGDFRLGQFKTLVGWEEGVISSTATTFLERALPVQAVNMGRRLGVDWTYQGLPHWLVTLGYQSGGDLNGDNDGHGPSAHVVFNPLEEKNEVVHLGVALSRENRGTTTDGRGIATLPTARFRARPEANLTSTRLVDSGNLKNAGDIDRFGLEGAWIHGPLLAQGEYLRFRADFSDVKPTYTGGGYYLLAAWMLTGESRDYKAGAVGNVTPAHRYGAIEIAARYSEVDLNDGTVLGGMQHDWTLGANWYLGSHLKFQVNYVHAYSNKYNAALKRSIEIDPRIFELRTQVYF